MAVRIPENAIEIDENLFVSDNGDEIQIQLKENDYAVYTVHLEPLAQWKLLNILEAKLLGGTNEPKSTDQTESEQAERDAEAERVEQARRAMRLLRLQSFL